MGKRVTITLTMDSSFVSMLNATVELSNIRNKDTLTAVDVLAVVALYEARGAFPEEIHAVTPPEWRGEIEAVHELRKVEEINEKD